MIKCSLCPSVCSISACLLKAVILIGPGICHGIAGNGYAFLVMYRLTGELEYLYRAQCFADVMFQKKVQEYSRTPDNPYSYVRNV